MHVVTFQPDIPQNLGALMRLSVCFGMPLHVIEPCGFPYSDKAVRRAAMDYAADADLRSWPDWDTFLANRSPGRLVLLTTKASAPHWGMDWKTSDYLILGRESAGVPEHVHGVADVRVIIPMPGGGRSLNMAISAGIVMADVARPR
jgi:tRNA (cytidine/uridine-2'-O-)-methyltransferase